MFCLFRMYNMYVNNSSSWVAKLIGIGAFLHEMGGNVVYFGGCLFYNRVRGAMVTSGDFSRASLSFYDAGAAGHLLYFCKLLTLLTKYTLNIHIHIVGYLHQSV